MRPACTVPSRRPRRRGWIMAATRSGPSPDPGRSAALPARGARPDHPADRTAEAPDADEVRRVSGDAEAFAAAARCGRYAPFKRTRDVHAALPAGAHRLLGRKVRLPGRGSHPDATCAQGQAARHPRSRGVSGTVRVKDATKPAPLRTKLRHSSSRRDRRRTRYWRRTSEKRRLPSLRRPARV